VAAVEKAITPNTVGILVEPIQGEAGVVVPHDGFLKGLETIARKNNVLLAIDEVQTGFGRTGKWFAKEHSGVMPDIMTLAKALAGGLPMGAMLAHGSAAEGFSKGDHGSTFAGGPLISAAALAVIEVIKEERLVERSAEMGEYLRGKLKALAPREIRGLGLMVGVDLGADCKALVEKALSQGAILNNTAEHTLRLIPPLVVGRAEIDQVVKIIGDSL